MSDNVLEITDVNFDSEVTNSDIPVLLDFWAEWCGPCRMLAPTIEELAQEYKGKVKVGKVNTDDNRNTAVKFNISAIPTIIIFKGGEAVDTKVGMATKKDLKEALDAVI
ncbi:MAG: thioredoxin [Phycisphaerae bacterium]|nr:thioredoxin [Phycisphaerae bacterium]